MIFLINSYIQLFFYCKLLLYYVQNKFQNHKRRTNDRSTAKHRVERPNGSPKGKILGGTSKEEVDIRGRRLGYDQGELSFWEFYADIWTYDRRYRVRGSLRLETIANLVQVGIVVEKWERTGQDSNSGARRGKIAARADICSQIEKGNRDASG